MKGLAVCAKRFVAETGHELGIIGDDYKPPCNTMEAYLACSIQNTEAVVGPFNTTSTSGIASMNILQKQTNLQLRQSLKIDCQINITELVQKIHEGTAPFLGPPGNAKTPAMDAMVTCMASFNKEIQIITSNNGDVITEMCPKLKDVIRCYFLGAGIDVQSMTESEMMNAQWEWNQQIAQSEQLVNQLMAQSGQQMNTSIDCTLDIKQMFGIGHGAVGGPYCLSILVACVLASCLLLLPGQRPFNWP